MDMNRETKSQIHPKADRPRGPAVAGGVVELADNEAGHLTLNSQPGGSRGPKSKVMKQRSAEKILPKKEVAVVGEDGSAAAKVLLYRRRDHQYLGDAVAEAVAGAAAEDRFFIFFEG